MYRKSVINLRRAQEVHLSHSGRHKSKKRRKGKQNMTPESMKKNNLKLKELKCRRKLYEHFDVNDYFMTLTYRVDSRPENMKECKEHFRAFARILRRAYKSIGSELKYIRNIERGSRGAWHIHMVLNRIPDIDTLINNSWSHGKVYFEVVKSIQDFTRIAAYITKTPDNSKKVLESNYAASKNMPIPDAIENVVRSDTWNNDIYVPEGYRLDKESLEEGINPYTGYPYKRYYLIRETAAEMEDRRKKVLKCIPDMNDSLYRDILILRYKQGKSMRDTAAALCYSLVHMRRLHKKALESIGCS